MITDVQRANRLHTIGSSEAAAILGLSPYASAWDVWAEKRSMLRAGEGSEAAELGDAMEGHLVEWASKKLNLIGLRSDVVLLHAEHPIFVSNADAVGTEEDGEDAGIEAKTAGLAGPLVGDWGEEYTDAIPEQYWIQCQFQMACSKLNKVFVPALLGGRGRSMFVVRRNEHTIGMMIPALLKFWADHVLTGLAPERSHPTEETISRILRAPGKTIEVEASVVDRWAAASEERLAAEKIEKEIKNEMLGRLGDAEEGILPDGRRLTYFETHRKAYSVAASSYRTPRITKGWKP